MAGRPQHPNYEARMSDSEPVVDPKHVEFNQWFNVLFPDQTPDVRFKLIGATIATWNAALDVAARRFYTMLESEGYERNLTADQVADIIERIKVSTYVNIN